MAPVDSWTDDTAERAIHLLRVAVAVVREMRRYYTPSGDCIRPVTVDRWLIDADEFVEENRIEEDAHATATAD